MKKKIIVITAVILLIGCLLGALFAFGVFDKDNENNDKNDKVTWDKNVTKPPVSVQAAQYVDTNSNEIADCFEKLDTTTDTDNDGISDYNEIIYTLTNPLLSDTDNNGTTDADEDNDKDGLSNINEIEHKTSPTSADTDADGLNDSEEINTHFTDPLKADTDSDGASDGWEVTNGTKPNEFNDRFTVTTDSTSENITASVELSASGTAAESILITPVTNHPLIDDTIPGYIGPAFEYLATGEIGMATLCFEFDNSLLSKVDFQPTIYCLNEDTQKWYELDTTVSGNIATAKTTHFSKYIILDKTEYASFTNTEYEINGFPDDGTDSNNDGISDYITKLMCAGTIRTGTCSLIFGNYTYEEVQANDDLDGDGLKNGEEIITDYVPGIPDDAATFNNHYYKVFDVGHNWLDSQAYCESMGGYLLTITSSEEQEFISTLIATGEQKTYWLGATDVDNEGEWKWVTNEPWIYQNWTPGEPNNGDAGEDYAEIITWRDNTWNDGEKEGDTEGHSKENHGYICEWNHDNVSSRTAIFINSSPICDDTDKDGFKDVLDPTPNDADVFASMEAYKDYFYKDQTTVTLFVKQPVWNSRLSYSNADYKRSKIYHDVGGNGHVYLGIDYADGSKSYFGFCPSVSLVGQISLVLFDTTVDGYVSGELYDSETGQNNETTGIPIFTVAKTFAINDSQADAIIKYRNDHLEEKYNLVDYNCVNYAIDVLKEGGIDVEISQHDWLLLDDTSLKIAKKVLKTANFVIQSPLYVDGVNYLNAETLQVLTSIHFWGYCPADAAEDIKSNYNDYLTSRNYTLNDGSTVTGYQVTYYNLHNEKNY